MISVIVPIFNSARYLAETLEAILAQTRPADEIIAVDDGSTDDSAAIADWYAPDVRVLRADHAGTAATRQRGYQVAHGSLIACCDADDVWLPAKLERQADVLAEHPDVDAVGCRVDEFLSPDADPSAMPGRGIRLNHPAPLASALLIRRTFLAVVDGFRSTEVGVGEYVKWYAEALSAGLRTTILDEVLLRRRLHENNSSRSFADESDDYLRIIQDHIGRQRRASA